jgi:protein-S-isoprenylcysteine O-methyltransferase Ste14
MKATALEFRFRLWIFLAIYILGFVAPWDFVLHLDGTGPNAHVWARLAIFLSRNGATTIGAAFNGLLIAGIVCAGLGAWMRTWGSAYLGVDVMRDGQMRGDRVVADGPYRYVRNPLYLGVLIHTLALALLMPASGAIFALVLVVIFQVRLIFGEEAFLREKLGEPYVEYCAKVPRLMPALRPRVAGSGARPQWVRAAVAEIFMWGVTASFAVLGWRYDATLLIQCVLVWLGVSLVAHALDEPATPPIAINPR